MLSKWFLVFYRLLKSDYILLPGVREELGSPQSRNKQQNVLHHLRVKLVPALGKAEWWTYRDFWVLDHFMSQDPAKLTRYLVSDSQAGFWGSGRAVLEDVGVWWVHASVKWVSSAKLIPPGHMVTAPGTARLWDPALEKQTVLGEQKREECLDFLMRYKGYSRMPVLKKEFIGPGLHLRPVHADHARPLLQWTLNSVFSAYENNNRRIRPPADRGTLKIVSRLLIA